MNKELTVVSGCMGGMRVERVSKWISIQYEYVTKRHALYDYSDDGQLMFFKYHGKRYALGQFMRFDFGPNSERVYYEGRNGEKGLLACYDSTEYYYPLMIELQGDKVRLYKEVAK